LPYFSLGVKVTIQALAVQKITFAHHTNGEVSMAEVTAAVIAVMSVISSVLAIHTLRPGVNFTIVS
jgi:hypothetical protein